jgi:hypothetical protein
MTSNQRRLALAGLLAILVVAAPPVAAQAPTVDTETTTTSTVSEVTDGMTVQNFTANGSLNSTLQASYDSTNPKVEVLNEDDEVITSYTAADMTKTGSTSTLEYYNLSVAHDVWDDVPITPGEDVEVHLKLYNNTEASTMDTTLVNITLSGASGRTVTPVADPGTTEAVSVETPAFSLGFLDWGDTAATYKPSSVPINGSNSTVTVTYSNGTAIDALDLATTDADTGDRVKKVAINTDNGPVKAYVDEAPADVNTSATYAIVDPAANEVVIHTGEDYAGAASIDGLAVHANADFWTRNKIYGWNILGGLPDLSGLTGTTALPPVAAAGVLAAGRPQSAA